jgi:hypothetical protein
MRVLVFFLTFRAQPDVFLPSNIFRRHASRAFLYVNLR